jgi:hypothetical protein
MSSLIQPELRRNLPVIGLVIYIVIGIATILVWSVVSRLDARRAGNETVQVDAAPLSVLSGTKGSPMRGSTSVRPLINDGSAEAKEPPPLAAAPPAPAPQSASVMTTASLPANDESADAKEPPPLAVAQPAPQSNSSLAVGSTLVLDNDEIAMLLKRGNVFLTNGDLASARLLLSRAAEAGSAEAALELGTTFDPLILLQRGVIGVEPDAARARKWYQRAAELGSTVATQQLAKLNRAH